MRPLMVVLLAAICVAAAWLRPRAAVLLWMAVAALAAPLPLLSVRATRVHFAAGYLALLLLLWGRRMWQERHWQMAPSRLNLPLLTLALAAVLSSLHAALFHDPDVRLVFSSLPARAYATLLVVLSAGAALLVANHVDGVAGLRWTYRVVLLVGIVFVVAPFQPLRFYADEPSWWPLVLAHGLALTWARVLYDRSWAWPARVLGAAVVVAAAALLILPQLLHPERGGQWLAGWLAVALPLGLITLVWSRKIVLAVLPFALVAAYVYVPRVVEQARLEGAGHRLALWADAGRLALLRPFFGVGPGNYPDYLSVYGARLDPYSIPQDVVTSAHGDYQQVAAEMGFVGLAALLWVVIEALRLAWRFFRDSKDPFLRAFALGVLGALGGMAVTSMVGDYLLPAYHNGGHTSFCTTVYTWVMIGALMVIESARAERRGG